MKPLRPHNFYGGTTCPGRATGQVSTIRSLIPEEDDNMKLLHGTPSGRIYVHGELGKRHIPPGEYAALKHRAGYEMVDVPDAELEAIPDVGATLARYCGGGGDGPSEGTFTGKWKS